MKKILEILTYIDGGGAEMVVYNYLSHMNLREFDIDIYAIDKGRKQSQEDDFKALGCNIIYIPKSIPKRISFVRKLIKDRRYNVIHTHCYFLTEFYLFFGMIYGAKFRIKHIHIANPRLSFAQHIISKVEKPFNKILATHYFACGLVAYQSYWGKYHIDNPKSYILNNAVDISKFSFSNETRKAVRDEFNWNNKRVYIDVARFNYQKNHSFLIKIFKAITMRDDSAILVLIGTGELMNNIKEQVENLGLKNKVFFLGNRNDVPRILNGCDCFLLPSLFEGLPVVGIESQTNGLPIIFSETITKECDITNIAKYLPIGENDIISWVDTAEKAFCADREKYASVVSNAGYNIMVEAKKLYNFYKQ